MVDTRSQIYLNSYFDMNAIIDALKGIPYGGSGKNVLICLHRQAVWASTRRLLKTWRLRSKGILNELELTANTRASLQ